MPEDNGGPAFRQAVKNEDECFGQEGMSLRDYFAAQARATDSNIRQALIDRFGPTTEKAIGKAKTPGPLFGIKSHEWAALAVAITWHDQNRDVDPIRPGVTAQW